MAKKILIFILSMALVLNSAIVFAAQPASAVKEDKTAKVFIDGVAFKSAATLLLKDGTPMLSTDYFTALGITAKNQVWDKTKKKLTLTKGATKLTLELDKSDFTLNGKKGSINVKPLKNNGKAYFPAEFVATSFGYKFIPDIATNTYFIKNNSDFIKNEQLLNNILKAMNGTTKVKVSENATLNLNGTGMKLNFLAQASTLSDRVANSFNSNAYYKMTANGVITENKVQLYLDNNQMSTKVNDLEWNTLSITEDEAALQFDFKGIFEKNDLVCSALNIVKGANKDELILKGNIIMGSSIPSFMNGQGLVNNKVNMNSIEITLNKDTYIVSKIALKQSGTTVIQKNNYNFSVDYLISYSDVNGSFDIVIPEELKK